MSRPVIAGLKLGGIFSLGLLTGVQINFSVSTIQTILTLASAPQAKRAFVTSLGALRALVRPLELVSSAALLSAYFLSPARGRHPYLVVVAVSPALGIAIEKLKLSGVEIGVLSTETVRTRDDRRGIGAEVEINGEVVRGGLEDWRYWGLLRGGLSGLGFFCGLVGIWGDGV